MLLTPDRNEKEHEKLNIEKVLNFIKYYMEHFPELLLGNESLVDNASFFGLIFEERPTYYDLTNGTPKLSSLFKLYAEYQQSKSLLVTPHTLITNTMIADFVAFVKDLMVLFPQKYALA